VSIEQERMSPQLAHDLEEEIAIESEQAADPSPLRRLADIRTIASFGIAIALLGVLVWRSEINFAEIWRNILSANPAWYVVAFVVYYATFPLRGLRWRYLLENTGVQKEPQARVPGILGLAEIIYLGWFANTLVPAKLGDAYRAYLLKKNARVSFSTTFGTVFAERIIDMLVLFGMLFLASLTFLGRTQASAEATQLEQGIVLLGAVMSLVIVVALFVFWRLGDPIEARLPKRFKPRFAALHAGTIQSFRRLPQLGALTMVIWIMEAGRLFFVAQALGFPLDPAVVVFVALAGSILTTIPLTPGGLALVEGGTIGLLIILVGMTSTDAASMAVLDRTISYWSLVIGGFLVFLVTRKK
jgi:uncharacterized protein (TIRG00374 family)